ncbi:MAG: hypothetical protein J1F33_00130 [Clostridiales bacterium]|nr:hypothetical protein [Clostridiales bacterium]
MIENENSISEILEELRDELAGKHGLFSKKKVDIDYCEQLTDRLAKLLPAALNEAEHVKQKRKEILSNADLVAKNTIRAAEEQAEKLAQESEVIKRANESAKAIIENAYVQCDNLILRTKSHLDNLFAETEKFLLTTLSVIRTNREELRVAQLDQN